MHRSLISWHKNRGDWSFLPGEENCHDRCPKLGPWAHSVLYYGWASSIFKTTLCSKKSRKEQENGIHLFVVLGCPSLTLVLHQGIGVLGVWDVAEAQLRQSRREGGKNLLTLLALEARVPRRRTFLRLHPQGALGCSPEGGRHLQTISSQWQDTAGPREERAVTLSSPGSCMWLPLPLVSTGLHGLHPPACASCFSRAHHKCGLDTLGCFGGLMDCREGTHHACFRGPCSWDGALLWVITNELMPPLWGAYILSGTVLRTLHRLTESSQ